jgi:hypothetical protein
MIIGVKPMSYCFRCSLVIWVIPADTPGSVLLKEKFGTETESSTRKINLRTLGLRYPSNPIANWGVNDVALPIIALVPPPVNCNVELPAASPAKNLTDDCLF